MTEPLPVAVVGGGPVGLITALGLVHHGIPVMVFEEDEALSLDTKAGTVLTRTLEVLHRYDAVDTVLRASLRIDEIGDLDRATGTARDSVRTGLLTEDTRFPFVVNIPQHHMEPVLHRRLDELAPGTVHMKHRMTGFTQHSDHVEILLDTPEGERRVAAQYLLACDGGRSQTREQLGITVEGHTLDQRYMLVDLEVDLDVANPRDYPYLAYFGDPAEWMILVRQPHCWRFLYPLESGRPEPDHAELAAKAKRFIGDVDGLRVIGTNIYPVHHRVANRWRVGRVFLMGDAAHLITPMWALGLNTGVLDASNLPWRLAWVLRGWADESILDGYEREQAPVAVRGSGEMAEAARAYMDRRDSSVSAMAGGGWGVAVTRSLLGVRLDVDGTGDWSMIATGDAPHAARTGDRLPDVRLFGPDGAIHVHDLCADAFVALYFTDARRNPQLPADSPGLRRYVVSRWDAPLDSGLRDRALFDPGERATRRLGVAPDSAILVRPDGHVAAIVGFDPADPIGDVYARITGRASAQALAEGLK
ncbi:3-(3-hydroxy-phenyl)propionate hydroxylase [Kibdelosporangium banguiense]|uniref:3-(3-hydroxy-phenyl)propionate hydroxylase n=1 Tax=Kibdelosporangium banguiense TaxID=1365924 RepID=A0ABS4TVC1_9PSEU|nr:FAD-dependent monooxygenase [Kibdelosporangium banguiense]MBP2327881.1 3-(3-hydroxy-phenyl)propionate hydroxylase [Kibdelosporangium banguiense]